MPAEFFIGAPTVVYNAAALGDEEGRFRGKQPPTVSVTGHRIAVEFATIGQAVISILVAAAAVATCPFGRPSSRDEFAFRSR